MNLKDLYDATPPIRHDNIIVDGSHVSYVASTGRVREWNMDAEGTLRLIKDDKDVFDALDKITAVNTAQDAKIGTVQTAVAAIRTAVLAIKAKVGA